MVFIDGSPGSDQNVTLQATLELARLSRRAGETRLLHRTNRCGHGRDLREG
jgi:hypothetical protein